jgi:hypothetical protein
MSGTLVRQETDPVIRALRISAFCNWLDSVRQKHGNAPLTDEEVSEIEEELTHGYRDHVSYSIHWEPPWCGLCYAPAIKCACELSCSVHLLPLGVPPDPEKPCACGEKHPRVEPRLFVGSKVPDPFRR